MEATKSHVEQKLLKIVNENVADVYAHLACVLYREPSFIRKDDEQRDREYIAKRLSAEGIAFLTETLPRLGEWFDKMLWGQKIERVEGFKPYDGLYPCFLRPIWKYFHDWSVEQVTDDEACLIRSIRTLLLGMKKLNVPSSEEKVAAKIASFYENEQILTEQLEIFSDVHQRAREVMHSLLAGYKPTCERPKHGPGAVAGGERHSEKWNFSTFYEDVHREWPYYDYVYPVRSTDPSLQRAIPLQLLHELKTYKHMLRVKSPVARLLIVPKDSKGPRIISCEPKELMYLQQGVSSHLMEYIERHPYTKGRVNFVNQDINANLALESSRTKEWDTIDLSDASDLVSDYLVFFLTPKEVYRKWAALRSKATMMLDKSILTLMKFAPMGSALCFPIESLVFWSIAVASVWKQTGDVELARNSVYVYGDDIIIRAGYTEAVMEALEAVDLKVNRNKSFVGNHPFRESCGIEALNGHNITPFRTKKLPPQRPTDGDGVVAYIKYAENMQKLMPFTTRAYLDIVESLVGPIPRVPIPQGYLSFVTDQETWKLQNFHATWSPERCYYRAKLLTIKTRKITDAPYSWRRLQRALVESFADRDPAVVVDRQSTRICRKMVDITYLGWEPT